MNPVWGRFFGIEHRAFFAPSRQSVNPIAVCVGIFGTG